MDANSVRQYAFHNTRVTGFSARVGADTVVDWGGEGTELSVVRSLNCGWVRLCAAAICLVLPGSATLGGTVGTATTLEERKLPMNFTWHEAEAACAQDCAGWIGAVGVITAETPAKFEEFSSGRNLKGATVVLDSSGGSVLDAIALGRRWRGLGLRTTVGIVIEKEIAGSLTRNAMPDAYCESMCVFLLLSGNTRTVPDGARVRVHQIWMGDRADDARAANYSADDMMIVERDIGRLAKYTFDMGGTGDLLSLALSVPPWGAAASTVGGRTAPDQSGDDGCRRRCQEIVGRDRWKCVAESDSGSCRERAR